MPEESNRSSLKEEYIERENWIRAMIQPLVEKADIEELIRTGAPSDTYENEISTISQCICREMGLYGKIQLSIDQIAAIVANVFCLNFHGWTQLPRMNSRHSKLAELIWRTLYQKERAYGS